MTTRIPHFIDGKRTELASTRTADVMNPSTGQVQSQVVLASAADVDTAVTSAAEAQKEWAAWNPQRRARVMMKFIELVNAHTEELAELLSLEHGKTIPDAKGDIQRGIEVIEFAIGIPHLLKGEYTEGAGSGIDVYSLRQPLGVVAGITPFNFPAMIPLWKAGPALACGNAFILKPSERDPSVPVRLAELFLEAGLPAGVFQVVHGDKEAVDAILEHPDIASVSFVGSTPIAKYIYETASAHGKRVQALGGAKNHMLVLPDADLDLAADSAVNAGFGSAGERCMAVSVVLAVDSIADTLVDKIAERMATLRTGDGLRGCDMGPLITAAHRDKVASYIGVARDDGATVVVDGAGVEVDGEPGGFWLGPTLLDAVPTSSAAYRDEIFGPVLSVVRVGAYDEAIEIINASPYGNGTAIFTNDGGAARRFQREVSVGMVGINVPIPVPVAYHSFGGWKASLFGDAKAYGPQAFSFFTREKAVTSRWLDPSHGGVNLGFPQNT